MKRLFYIKILLVFFFILQLESLHAFESYCIRENGLLRPLINNEECLKKEIKINQSEFREIKNLDPNLRPEALLQFRKKENARKEIEEIEKEEKIKENLNLVILENKYQEKCQKGFFGGFEKGSKEYNQCLIFSDQQDKIELKNKEERAAELKKKQEEWKLTVKKREEERTFKLAQLNKKLAGSQEKKLISSNSKETESDSFFSRWFSSKNQKEQEKVENETKKLDKTKDDSFKFFYYDKNIVNKDKIDPIIKSNIEISVLDKLNKLESDNLLKKYSNFILVQPIDFVTFSSIANNNKMTSNYVAGIQQVPNPQFSRLQMELQNAQREYIIWKQKEAYFFRKGQNPGNYSWLALMEQASNVAAQIAARDKADGFKQLHNNLTASLSTTPMYVDKEILQPYSYNLKNIETEKKAIFKVIEFKNNQLLEKSFVLSEKKFFKVSENLQVSDKNYEKLKSKFNSLEDIKIWENKPMSQISYNVLLEKYSQIDLTKSKILNNQNELYASLGFSEKTTKKERSFFSRLFNFGSEDKKYDKEERNIDKRFKSVVIIRNGNSFGSGFYIEKDKIITNFHVVENSSSLIIENFDGEKGTAKILKTDKMRDLALLEVNLKGKPAELSSEALYSGMQVTALGHPSGLNFSITQGIISSVRKHATTYDLTGNSNILFVQTDAAINKGNSGGPLFHKNLVVGVNTQGLSKSSTEGLNFAVHVEELKKFLNN